MCFFHNQRRYICESAAENRHKKAEQSRANLKRSRQLQVSADHEVAHCTPEIA